MIPPPTQRSSSDSSELPPGTLTPAPSLISVGTPPATFTSGVAGSTAKELPAAEQLAAQLQFADSSHQYIREYIQLADQKAAFFFAAATALLAFLYNKGYSARWLKSIETWAMPDLVSFLAMVSLALTSLAAISVVIPRTRGSRRGLLFWGAIAAVESGDRYASEVMRLAVPDLCRVTLEHCYDLAGVCRAKYRMLSVATRIGLMGLFCTLVLLLLGQ